jgi:hypothetical protein
MARTVLNRRFVNRLVAEMRFCCDALTVFSRVHHSGSSLRLISQALFLRSIPAIVQVWQNECPSEKQCLQFYIFLVSNAVAASIRYILTAHLQVFLLIRPQNYRKPVYLQDSTPLVSNSRDFPHVR